LELKPDLILVDSVLNKKILKTTISMINKLDLPFIYISSLEEGFKSEIVDQTKYFGTLIKPVNSELLKTSIEFALNKNLKEKESKARINTLEKRESRYNALIESSFDSVYIMNPDWSEMKHLKGRNFLNNTLNPSKSWINSYIPPEEREKVLNAINKAIKNRTKFELEHKVIASDGTVSQTLSRAVPVLNADEKIIEWIGTAKDITKRTKIEWELTETKSMLESVIESIPDAVFVSDAEGNFLKFNKAFATYHKFKSKKDVKKTLKEYPEFLELYDDEKTLVPLDMWAVPRALRGETKFNEEYLLKRKDTGEKWWGSYSFAPIKNKNGQVTGSVVVGRDITSVKSSEIKLKEINQTLKEREEQLRLFIENAPASIAMFDNEMKYISASNRWIADYNLKDKKLVGKSHYVVFPEITEELKQVHKRVLAGSTEQASQDKFVRIDGTVQWLKWEAIPWYSPSGSIGGIIIFTEDITDLKLASDALEDSQEKYKYVIETAEEGIILLDKNGTIIEANPKSQELFGDIHEQLIGKNLEYINKELKISSDNFKQAFKAVLNEKSISNEWEYFNKKGEKKFIRINLSLMKKQSEIERIAVVVEDITDLKMRERSLKENEQFLDNIIDNIPDMIFVKTADELRFERVNQATENIWGYDRDEIIGKTDYDLFPQDKANSYTKDDLEVLKKSEFSDIPEEIIDTKYDGERILHTKKIPLLDEKGRSKYLLGISEDITQRKLDEIQLKKSLDEKEALLKEVYHRVKNNMQIISSLLNLQIANVQGEESKDILKDSQSRIKSMAMIHEKLYMSKDLSHINFKEYVEHLVTDIFYTYGIKVGSINPILRIENIELNMETAIPLGLIINEIVINSLKFAFPQGKGSIKIIFKSFNSTLSLTVADDGIGIPENIDYQKTDSLGLQLVTNLVDQLNGEISLETKQGTKFNITFKELEYKKRI
jgi:PAS domain S-box-containing protein